MKNKDSVANGSLLRSRNNEEGKRKTGRIGVGRLKVERKTDFNLET